MPQDIGKLVRDVKSPNIKVATRAFQKLILLGYNRDGSVPQGNRILVVEDELDIRLNIMYTLMTIGDFRCIGAKNGAEAIVKAQEELPDLILMDVRMPHMTGYEACAKLKEIPTTQNIPVVFLSAKGQEQEIRQGMQVGAEEYLLKPYSPGELTETIRDILHRLELFERYKEN